MKSLSYLGIFYFLQAFGIEFQCSVSAVPLPSTNIRSERKNTTTNNLQLRSHNWQSQLQLGKFLRLLFPGNDSFDSYFSSQPTLNSSIRREHLFTSQQSEPCRTALLALTFTQASLLHASQFRNSSNRHLHRKHNKQCRMHSSWAANTSHRHRIFAKMLELLAFNHNSISNKSHDNLKRKPHLQILADNQYRNTPSNQLTRRSDSVSPTTSHLRIVSTIPLLLQLRCLCDIIREFSQTALLCMWLLSHSSGQCRIHLRGKPLKSNTNSQSLKSSTYRLPHRHKHHKIQPQLKFLSVLC